jgi:hypothetical protein
MACLYEVSGSEGCIRISRRHALSMGNNGNGSGSRRGPLHDPGALLLIVSFLDRGVSQMGRICDCAGIKKNTPRMFGRWGVDRLLTPADGQFSWGSVLREDNDGCRVVVWEGGGGKESR